MGTFQKGINYLLGEIALASATVSRDREAKKKAELKEADKKAKLDAKTEKAEQHKAELENEAKTSVEAYLNGSNEEKVQNVAPSNEVSMTQAKVKTQKVINQKYEQKSNFENKKKTLAQRKKEAEAKELLESKTKKIIDSKFKREMIPYAK